MKRLGWLVGALLFQITVNCYGAPDTTMTITPSATSGTTITASDENTRNNAISTSYNAHSHTDLTRTTNNIWTVGDGTSGTKDFCEDSVTDRCIRWNETAGLWTIQQPTASYNQLTTASGTTGLTQYTVLLGNGTSSLDNVQGVGTSGQVLTSNGAGARPTFQAAAGNSKFVGSFTRDTSAASGTQAVTGTGFTPTSITFFCAQDGAVGEYSSGFTSGTASARNGVIRDGQGALANSWENGGTNMISDEETGSNVYNGILSSFDSNGFTISWTRTGTPTGTLTCQYLAAQ